MTPGPVPPGARSMNSRSLASRLNIDPNATASPDRSYGGGMWQGAIRSRPMPAVRAEIALAAASGERLWSGNIGRLWTSQIASTAGDLLVTGIIFWFLQITGSFNAVFLLLLMMALPPVLMGFFGGHFAAIRDTRRLMTMLGILRVGLALVLVLMHFYTIVPIVLVLAFGLSLASSLRGSLRRAAIAHTIVPRARSVLASGDQLVAGALAVLGPALAVLLYILDGERIFTISIGAALCYFLTAIGETRAEPLPDKLLFQHAASDAEANESVWEGDEDEDESSTNARIKKAESLHPIWEMVPPPNVRAAMSDVRHGLLLIGTSSHALAAFLLLILTALVGGIVALLQPFYVTSVLRQVPLMLGLFFVAAGAGSAIGSAIVVELRRGGQLFMLIGGLGAGVALVSLVRAVDMQHALAYIFALGAANVFIIRGSQIAMLRHFVPVGQRAIVAATSGITSLMTFIGIVLGAGIITQFDFIRHRPISPAIGLTNLLIICGLTLIVGTIATSALAFLPNRELGFIEAEDLDEIPDDSDEDDEWDDTGASRRYPSQQGRYDESTEYSTYSPAYTDEYSSYSRAYPEYTNEYEDYGRDDERPRRR
jgi:hypothetical protein